MALATEDEKAFDLYLRTGRRIPTRLVERKFNPYHDPRNGRFTFAPGGTKVGGPFRTHSARPGRAGEIARKLNRLANNPDAVETVELAGQRVTVKRLGGREVELTLAGGDFRAEGEFSTLSGKQAIRVKIHSYKLGGMTGLAATIVSFPTTVTIFSNVRGQLAYSIDRPVEIKKVIGSNIRIPVGAYILAR